MKDLNIVVPDRFETLQRRVTDDLPQVVERVPTALSEIDKVFRRMQTAGRGAFLLLRGDSGSGKSTFLHTLKFFKEGVVSISVPSDASIRNFLEADASQAEFRIFVLEEREATVSFADSELETWLHEINGYIRAPSGSNALVVWPCNTDELRERIERLATKIGGKSLIGPSGSALDFKGLGKDKFPAIAARTLSLVNQGASLSDLGLTEEQVKNCAAKNELIGEFFSDLHNEIENVQGEVATLVDKETCRLWVLVVAGNEPHSDVSALTRGASAAIDTERLMSATEANIVAELQKFPQKIGIVGTVLDAKILHMPILAMTSIARAYASDTLKARMKVRSFSLKPDKKQDAINRLKQSELGLMLSDRKLGIISRAKKIGPESRTAFEKLADIASTNDRELNDCIGRALKDAKLVHDFKTEVDFGAGMVRRTDLYCQTAEGPVRVEVMWRRVTGRADIANYTLTKVHNYARAIGFM